MMRQFFHSKKASTYESERKGFNFQKDTIKVMTSFMDSPYLTNF